MLKGFSSNLTWEIDHFDAQDIFKKIQETFSKGRMQRKYHIIFRELLVVNFPCL